LTNDDEQRQHQEPDDASEEHDVAQRFGASPCQSFRKENDCTDADGTHCDTKRERRGLKDDSG
jgi:hypothetical protein